MSLEGQNEFVNDALHDPEYDGGEMRRRLFLRWIGLIFPLFVVLAVAGYFYARHFVRDALRASLPQIDGSLPTAGLASPVSVERDAHGVPHIRARSLDDLVFAQGYVTAQDRLWQMDMLRRHAAGELAEILGSSMLDHDRLQRTLQIRAAAERAVAALPANQMHLLEQYARGVNASIDAQRPHLPLEFRLLHYQPAPWTPRDSFLVGLVMFQDLSTGFPTKLSREALAARLSPDLLADLYPVGSWRDHSPDQPVPDLTAPQPEIEDVPLDESQTRVRAPNPAYDSLGAPSIAALSRWVRRRQPGSLDPRQPLSPADLDTLQRALAVFHPPCPECVAGSNNWAVSGTRTASGKPMLSNDMHLTMTVPGIWYEADLEAPLPEETETTAPSAPAALIPNRRKPAPPQTAIAPPEFHVAGVTLPGFPFVVVGHNAHVAWGFTNLGADVQDIYIEHARGTGEGAEFQSPDGVWHPILHHPEVIHVRGAADQMLDVTATQHGDMVTPILTTFFPDELAPGQPPEKRRALALRWTVYDPANITGSFFDINSARDGAAMVEAFSTFGGPAQNLIYADDQGHIGYHVVGRIPIRGDLTNPTELAPVPIDTTAADAATHEWAGYIPYDKLPQALDPADGVLATANSRVTPPGYPYPITLNWWSPYRVERIYKVLEAGRKLTPADMLALQTDVHSTLDQVIAQRLTYAIDHTTGPLKDSKTLREAADILREWNGQVTATSQAAAIVNAATAALWPMLLTPKLASTNNQQPATSNQLWHLYVWDERSYVEEELVMHTPARWLPPNYANWNDFLAAAVDRGLRDAHAPTDLSTFMQGKVHPLDVEHPILSRFALLRRLVGFPVGTGSQFEGGDSDTVKQAKGLLNPSERLTVDLSNPDRTTLNLPIGQSGSPASPWFLDQFPAWLRGATFPLPFTPAAAQPGIAHALTLVPAP
jgi:penicillin amidase